VKSKKVYFAQFALALSVAALSGCGALKRDDAAQVREHALERWNLLISHKAEKAYDFLTPGYRATITREDYAKSMNNRPVAWKSAEFVDQKCDQDACTVHVKLGYTVAINLHGQHEIKGNSPIEEHWIRESGHWYVLPDNRSPVRKPEPKSP
jgi:hypothetical protein